MKKIEMEAQSSHIYDLIENYRLLEATDETELVDKEHDRICSLIGALISQLQEVVDSKLVCTFAVCYNIQEMAMVVGNTFVYKFIADYLDATFGK